MRASLLKILAYYWDETQVMHAFKEAAQSWEILSAALHKYDFDDTYDWRANPQQNYIIGVDDS